MSRPLDGLPNEWFQAKFVSFGTIRRAWESSDLVGRQRVLEFVCANPKRIRPSIEDEWLYDSMASYLLECVLLGDGETKDRGTIHSPFEAARELVRWFNWFVQRHEDPAEIRPRVESIAALFRRGSSAIRNCLETGFLEHVLETPGNRRHFAHWRKDAVLAESYTESLKWGEAHQAPGSEGASN